VVATDLDAFSALVDMQTLFKLRREDFIELSLGEVKSAERCLCLTCGPAAEASTSSAVPRDRRSRMKAAQTAGWRALVFGTSGQQLRASQACWRSWCTRSNAVMLCAGLLMGLLDETGLRTSPP